MIDWTLFTTEDFEALIQAYIKQHYPIYADKERIAVLEVLDEDVKFGISGVTGVMVLSKKSLEYLIPGLVADRLEDFAQLDNSKRAVVKQMEDLVKSLEDHLQLWRTAGSGGTCGHGIGAALNNAKKNLEFFRTLYCN